MHRRSIPGRDSRFVGVASNPVGLAFGSAPHRLERKVMSESECGTCNNCWDCLIGDEYENAYVEGTLGTFSCTCEQCEEIRNANYEPEWF